ncbi:hypothetical protein COHA_008790 [Chlorella ohadii]|uniref:Uncharacterized protein n=1 Tax=Chlorella ohadii TaxID=2649997 RepID=A0AAD5GYN5_9CHLO|nr:hypothetical protein COHA_008790 [Chlorella ohadii]
MLMAAALAPSAPDLLAELAALPGAAGMLGAEQRRSVASLAVHQGDAAAVQTMLDGPLRQQPIDPDGSMLETVAGRSSDDVLPIARALLQHGTSITLPAINKVVDRRRNAELLELMLGSGLPLPAVPLGSEEESVTMFFGEHDTTESTHDVCCPFYSLFRRDCHYITKTPQELRVRMCQALLRAGYRPTVYNSVRLLVVSKTGYGCQSKSLPNFHILRDWGRLGRTADGTGRICCSPGADPQQDKLLTGDNRLLWMLIEGEPWSPADHRYWPPAFKAAVRTLLLAHRRGAPVKRGLDAPTAAPAAAELQATPLSPLPHTFVLAVIAAAAFPLNAWFDAASMEDWRAAEFWHEMDFAAWGFTQQAAQELDEQADL